MPDDFKANARTTGTVTVGGSATGTIGTRRDVDWFAVELVAGSTYVIDLEGSDTGGGTLGNTMLHGLYDSAGERIANTRDRDGGEGDNARLTFTASESGTYYIAARGQGGDTGTYTVRVTVAADPDATAAGAVDLGDLAGPDGARLRGSVDGGADGTDYYRFTLSETKRVELSLGRQDADADLYLEDGNGAVLYSSTKGGTGKEGIEETLQAGTYYVRVAAQEAGDNNYMLNAVATEPAVQPHAPPGEPQQEPQQPSVQTSVPEPETSSDAPQQRSVRSVQTSVSEPDGEDFSADTSTQGRIVVGDSVTGAADWRGGWKWGANGFKYDEQAAVDWFAVTLEKGKTYQIHQEGSTAGKGTLGNPVLRGIHDADGKLIAGTAAGRHGIYNDNSHLLFTPKKDGTYYVAAGAYKYNQGSTYTLSVTEVATGSTDDFAAGTDTTGKVKVGRSATGDIESVGDHDWFKVTLEKGQYYRIDLRGSETGDGTLIDPRIHGIYDTRGNLLSGTSDDDGGVGWNGQVLFAPNEGGTYYVAASAATHFANHNEPIPQTGSYTLSVAEGTDDFAAGVDTGREIGKVPVGGGATGEIEYSGDVDWFAFNVQTGRTYQIDLKGKPTGDGTLRDPEIRGIYDWGPDLIANTVDDDGGEGKNSRTTFTAGKTEVYYVAAGGEGNHRGTYTVSVDDVTPRSKQKGVSEKEWEDFPEDVSTPGRVAVGGFATGALPKATDFDWFAVDLEIGKTYRFDLKGLWNPDPEGGTLWDPILHGLYDAQENLLADTKNDDGGNVWDARMFFKAPETATYYVDVGTASEIDIIEGGYYSLSVVEHPDDYTADTDTSGRVEVGGSATGEITITKDVDWFAVELQAGTTYQIDLKGSETGDGTLWDPYLHGIHDKDGTFIPGTVNNDFYVSSDNRFGSRVLFTPEETGTHFVAAGTTQTDTGQLSDSFGTYTLSVEEVVDAM